MAPADVLIDGCMVALKCTCHMLSSPRFALKLDSETLDCALQKGTCFLFSLTILFNDHEKLKFLIYIQIQSIALIFRSLFFAFYLWAPNLHCLAVAFCADCLLPHNICTSFHIKSYCNARSAHDMNVFVCNVFPASVQVGLRWKSINVTHMLISKEKHTFRL